MRHFIPLSLLCLLLISCDRNSSPEGRMTTRLEIIQKDLDSLKRDNSMLRDSVGKIRADLDRIRAAK